MGRPPAADGAPSLRGRKDPLCVRWNAGHGRKGALRSSQGAGTNQEGQWPRTPWLPRVGRPFGRGRAGFGIGIRTRSHAPAEPREVPANCGRSHRMCGTSRNDIAPEMRQGHFWCGRSRHFRKTSRIPGQTSRKRARPPRSWTRQGSAVGNSGEAWRRGMATRLSSETGGRAQQWGTAARHGSEGIAARTNDRTGGKGTAARTNGRASGEDRRRIPDLR